MVDLQMGAVEARFAAMIWENEPISSAELARMSEAALGWKRTTAFTVLKRLCDKGIFRNEKGTVSSLLSRDEFYSLQSKKFVDETFDGSLPAFIAAFTSQKRLSESDVEELRRLVAGYEENK